MKKLALILAMFVGMGTALADSLVVEPVIKAEVLLIQSIEEDAEPVVVFGTNDFGVVATKGDVEVSGVVSIVDVPEYGVELSQVYLKKGIGEKFDITAGYQNIPFGYWTSNCVNYPLVRTGNYDPTFDDYIIKNKATQVEIGYTGNVIVADVAGYVGNSGTFSSVAGRFSADLAIIAPNLSVNVEDADSVSVAVGAEVDLGTVALNGVYYRGVNTDRMGSYFEVAVFPTESIITAIRADLLANTETNDGQSSFSLSGIYLITDNVYAGIEYTLQSQVLDSDLQEPTHMITGLIGCEF